MGDLFASGGSSGYPAALDTATTQTDATPTLPFDATAARASKVNNLATAVINIETELGTDPAGAYADVAARLDAISGDGGYYSVGLTGTNNSGTPTTQYDFAADLVALRDPSNSVVAIRTNTGTITNNVSTAGPAVNGRDQAGVFSASSWVHFYWIWNGTTLATVSSATAPPTGPTLPATYTHWAYITAIRFNGSSALEDTFLRGNRVGYRTATDGRSLSAGSATSETTIDVSAIVPPSCSHYFIASGLDIQVRGASPAAAAPYLAIRLITSVDFAYNQARVGAVATALAVTYASAIVPNVGQAYIYLLVFSGLEADATVRTTHYIYGYAVDNGGS